MFLICSATIPMVTSDITIAFSRCQLSRGHRNTAFDSYSEDTDIATWQLSRGQRYNNMQQIDISNVQDSIVSRVLISQSKEATDPLQTMRATRALEQHSAYYYSQSKAHSELNLKKISISTEQRVFQSGRARYRSWSARLRGRRAARPGRSGRSRPPRAAWWRGPPRRSGAAGCGGPPRRPRPRRRGGGGARRGGGSSPRRPPRQRRRRRRPWGAASGETAAVASRGRRVGVSAAFLGQGRGNMGRSGAAEVGGRRGVLGKKEKRERSRAEDFRIGWEGFRVLDIGRPPRERVRCSRSRGGTRGLQVDPFVREAVFFRAKRLWWFF
jgi:hypothetical protein